MNRHPPARRATSKNMFQCGTRIRPPFDFFGPGGCDGAAPWATRPSLASLVSYSICTNLGFQYMPVRNVCLF